MADAATSTSPTDGTAGPVVQTVPLGFQWPTIDPFLFCVHHLDRYPAGNGSYGPAASLSGRQLGSDFEPIDGWRMYHGTRAPGFPSHPHRGFETVTFVRRGLVDHADSLGAAARYGRGDVQWLTAGGGIQHAEMFPLLDTDGPNTLELFQIWVNLPASNKLAEPHFSMFWADDVPIVAVPDVAGRTTEVTVVAGAFPGPDGEVTPPAPPPASWASRPDSDVAIWHLAVPAGGTLTLPPAHHPDSVRVLYVFEGSQVRVGGTTVDAPTGVVVRSEVPVEVAAGEASEASLLVLQGRPIGEPVAQYGPFVMNSRAEIEQAFRDYQATGFGGWPWPDDDPVHGDDPGRFARRPDGSVERPAAAGVTRGT